MILIDGQKLSRDILLRVKEEVARLSFQPVFCDVLVGDDPSSVQYVRMKGKSAESVGIKFHNASFPSSITTSELVEEIEKLNKIKNMCGIIVQLPLPKTLDRRKILDSIDPKLDVDCLSTAASKRFYKGFNEQTDLGYPTGLACMAILDSLNISLKDKNIVVLGQGMLVGGPVTALLRFRGFDPHIVDIDTKNKSELIKAADIIISGIGRGKHITAGMVAPGVVLIDAGTSESDGATPSGQGRVKIVGDVDLKSVCDVAGYVSPVPGGVGPVTVAMLLNNVLKVAKSSR